MASLVPGIDKTAGAPKYLQLARAFEAQMRQGVLRVGDKLPSIRQLRDEHRVSAATAVGCFLWLERQGYVRARPKSGFYVARAPVSHAPNLTVLRGLSGPVPVSLGDAVAPLKSRETFDLGPAVVDAALLPHKRLNRSLRMALSAFDDNAVRYEDPLGSPRLRRQIARLIFRQGASASPEAILITAGETEAMNLTIRAVTRPGDVVAVESPGCYEILQALETLQLQAVEIPHVPRHGPDLDVLAEAVRDHRIAALLVAATCHNALGDCATDDSKAALVDFAAANAIPIVDGDPFGDLIFSGERPRPLKAFDTSGIVLQTGSFSHLVAPGFNIGWATAGRWQEEVERLKSISNLGGARLPQLALAEFLESGAYERHLKKLRLTLGRTIELARHEILELFPRGTQVSSPEGGFVLWVQLPPAFDGIDLQRKAAALGIRVLPGIAFSPTKQYRNCVRLACGYSFDVLRPALVTVARLLVPSS